MIDRLKAVFPSAFHPRIDLGGLAFVDSYGSKSLAPGATDTLCEFRTPINERGMIYAFGQGIPTPGGFADVIYRILINGERDIFYGHVRDQIGSFDQLTDITIALQPGDLVQVQIHNTSSTTTYLVAGRIKAVFF